MELLKKLYTIKKLIRNFLAQEIKVTSLLHIRASGERVFTFLSNPCNWTAFDFHSIHTIRFNKRLWEFDSARGPGYVFMERNESNMILSYSIMFEHEDIYEVAISVVNQGTESMSVVSITKPEKMPIEYFEYRLKELDNAFLLLKELLEAQKGVGM